MRKVEIHLMSVCFISYFVMFLTIWAGCGYQKDSKDSTGTRTEALTAIASGIITNPSGGEHMSYGLYALVGPPGYGDRDFLLVLRNTDSKFIDTKTVTKDNFRLQDSKGREARLVLRSLPQSVAWQEATSLEISAINFTNMSFPLVLTFKANLGVPVYLCITNISSFGK
jgi:hypothetical protein